MAFPRTIVALTSVAVAPTGTVLASWKSRSAEVFCVQVVNTDGAQTLSCVVRRRAEATLSMVATTLSDLASIAAGGDAVADIDGGGSEDIDVYGTASGAGLTAQIVVVQK